MPLRILVIDNQAREDTARVVAFASKIENRYVVTSDPKTLPGDNPNFVVHVSGFRCVFTWTESDGKVYRHLSVSIGQGGPIPVTTLPHPVMAQEIAHLFGFTGELTTWGFTVHRSPVLCLVLLQEIPNEIPKQS